MARTTGTRSEWFAWNAGRSLARTLLFASLAIAALAGTTHQAHAQSPFPGVPITLYQSYAGNVDFTGAGNTLRAASDAVNPCTVVPNSSATLTIPAGATITNAYLYWAGSGTTVDANVTLTGPGVIPAITADRTFQETFTIGATNYDFFAGFEDLTGVVTTGGVYTFSNLTVNTGAPHCGPNAVLSGWNLIVIYSRPAEPLRVINLYDGFRWFRGTAITLNASNFRTPTPLTAADTGRHAHLTWEGDAGNSGTLGGVSEQLQFDGNVLTDGQNPANNQFNSTINVLGANNVWGVDFDSYDITPFLTPAKTTAVTNYSSGQDLVLLSAEIFSVPNEPVADLSISKTHVGNFGVGSDHDFTITVTNNGPNPATGAVVTDTLPAGLTYVSGTGTGWVCGAVGQNVTCTHTGTQASGTSYPAITLTVAVDATALPSVVNTANVTGPQFDNQPANNSSTDNVTVLRPDLSTSTKSVLDVNGGDANPGDVMIYTITLNESAGVPAPGVQVTDDVPANVNTFTVTSTPAGSTDASLPAPAGLNNNGLLDVQNIDVPASGSVTITFEVTIAAGTPPGTIITNTAAVTNPNSPPANPSVPFTVSASAVPGSGLKYLYTYDTSPSPDLSRQIPPAQNLVNINEAAFQDWTLNPALVTPLQIQAVPIPVEVWLTERGPGNRRSYRIDFYRSGQVAPLGTVTVINQVLPNGAPAQFIYNLPNAALQNVTAGETFRLRITNLTTGSGNRRIRLHPTSGANFSRVHLPSNTVINVDSVDGYDLAYPAGVIPPSFAPGATVFARAVVSDPFGDADITGAVLTLTDPLGAPLAPVAMIPVSAPGVHPKVYEYAYVVPGAGPAGLWTMSVVATEGTEAVPITDLGVGVFAVVLPQPNLLVVKSVAVEDFMGMPNPKALPGASMIYTIRVTNSGPGTVDLDTLVLTDDIPAELEFSGADFDGVTSGPIRFDQGTPTSGLTYTFVALGDMGDDVEFRSTGPLYDYTPSAGYDPNVTSIRILPKGVLAASGGGGDPYFEVRFRVRVR